MEYYLFVIVQVMGVMHYFSLNDTVALCWTFSKVELIVLLAIIVMMFFYDYCLNVANCLHELIMVRDNVFAFSGDFHMSSCDLIDINL